jgi:hypothetical protein
LLLVVAGCAGSTNDATGGAGSAAGSSASGAAGVTGVAGTSGAAGTGVAGTSGAAGTGAPGPTGAAGVGDAGTPSNDARDGGAGTGAAGTGAAGSSVDAGATLAALDQACTPTFTLRLTDMGPKGQIFTDAVGGDAKAFVQDIGRKVCRILYRQASEVRAANSITLTIADYDGVAAKSGDVGEIAVQISTRHLENVKNQGRDVRAEIAGILHHEMTHMYQHDDKPEATFSAIGNMYESVGDAVRIRNGYAPAGCAPSGKTGTWSSKSYCGGGWFWVWAETVYPDFIYKLNGTMKGKDGHAWAPADATFITGKTIDQLWTDYQGAACCSGATRTCCTTLPP